jgi:hypothetical protein
LSDSRDVQWTVSIAIWALCLIAAFAGAVVITVHAAQEKDASYPPTRSWVLGSFERWPGSVSGFVNQIRVVDTAGVCLYILESEQGSFEHQRTQLVAVPKTQLPKGAGCQ